MQKLKDKLKEIKKEKRLGLMTHIVVGYPSLEATISLVRIMARTGVNIVELQIPFSDPLADGPTIMKACDEALSNGVKVKDAFVIMQHLSSEVSMPLLFMTYYNTVFKYGTEKFCADAKRAGAEGLIVPDVPIEEEGQEHFIYFCKKYNLANIRVVSPISTVDRLKKNAKIANGFLYCTARQGITGARNTLDKNIIGYLKEVRSLFSIPIAVGFGLSKRQHFEALKSYADIGVVGSAIIDIIDRSQPKAIEKNVASFINELKMVN